MQQLLIRSALWLRIGIGKKQRGKQRLMLHIYPDSRSSITIDMTTLCQASY